MLRGIDAARGAAGLPTPCAASVNAGADDADGGDGGEEGACGDGGDAWRAPTASWGVDRGAAAEAVVEELRASAASGIMGGLLHGFVGGASESCE